MAIKPGKGGSPGQPYQAPKEDPKNPYVPAPKKAKKNDIFHAKTTQPGKSVNDLTCHTTTTKTRNGIQQRSLTED